MNMRTPRLSLFLTDEANDFMQALAADTQAAAHRRGFVLEVAFAGQAAQQIQQIYARIHAPEEQRPDAVLVLPVYDHTLERPAAVATGAGIGWICLHRPTGDLAALRAEHPEVAVALVAPDHEEIGRLQGRCLTTLLKHGGRVLYVRGRTGNTSVPRRAAGLREVIHGTGIEIGDALDGNWSSKDAELAVARWMRLMIGHVTLHAIVCQNDAMAIGARRALRQAAQALHRPELLKLPLIGCDGLHGVGRRLVDDGELAATVVLPLAGSAAVDLLSQAAASGVPPPLEVLLRPQVYGRCAPHPSSHADGRPEVGAGAGGPSDSQGRRH